MEMQNWSRRELTLQEKRAARMWAEGFDIDGNPAVTKTDIAKRCGMTQQQLYLLFKRPEFLEEVDKCLGEQRVFNGRELLRNVPKAINKLVDIIDTGKDREAFQAAAKILSIAGYSDHKTVEVVSRDETGVIRGGFGKSDEVLPDANIIDVTDMDGDEE